MFFQESDVYNIKNHVECCRVDSIHTNGKSGSICFIEKSINIISCSQLVFREKNSHLEVLEGCIENITYIGIYASQKYSVQKLCNFIEDRAQSNENNEKIGDFNIRFDKLPKLLFQVLQKHKYKI